MSINPVQTISQIVEARLAGVAPRPGQPPAPVEVKPSAPIAENPPESAVQEKQNASKPSELPQDEVDVLRDSQTNGDVVVKYLDHAGNLILQVPSTQVLGVARAIEQDFREEAKLRATARTENKGGDSHGH
jgi:hypothetical protein